MLRYKLLARSEQASLIAVHKFIHWFGLNWMRFYRENIFWFHSDVLHLFKLFYYLICGIF